MAVSRAVSRGPSRSPRGGGARGATCGLLAGSGPAACSPGAWIPFQAQRFVLQASALPTPAPQRTVRKAERSMAALGEKMAAPASPAVVHKAFTSHPRRSASLARALPGPAGAGGWDGGRDLPFPQVTRLLP